MPQLDTGFVRSHFPAFSVPEIADKSFFENAGGSFVCAQVQERMARFYRERKMQPYWPYPPSSTGGEEMDEARGRLVAYLNVASDEVSFGPSTTQNVYVLAQAFGEWLSPGDVVIVTNQDHEANSGPWRRLVARGIELREWQINPETAVLDPEDLKNMLDDRVKLVAFPHCSNVVGAINPVREITSIAQQAGAFVCIDGVSFVPHGIPDVGTIGADIYLFSAYKTYGPHQGIMVMRRSLGMELPNQGHVFNAGALEKRFTPAGPDHAQVAACAGMLDYFDAIHDHHFESTPFAHVRGAAISELFRQYEEALAAPLLDFLANSNRARLIGPASPENRAPTISLLHEKSGEDLVSELAAEGILAGGGDFYAVRTLKALGIEPEHGLLRLSAVHYTSRKDIDRLIAALDRIL